MVAQTITTEQNYDGPTHLGLVSGDSITVDGGYLTINGDVRWGQNAAVPGNLTISAVNGGTILVDATQTWEIDYSGGTGTIPTLGPLGSNAVTGSLSGATGEILGVYAATGKAPASGAMLATGRIKLRAKTGNFANGEQLTLSNGAKVTVASATGGRRSWIHVVGRETGTITLPRLGLFKMIGDWFELGVTSGAPNQTFNFPVEDQCPAIQIETAPGSGVYEWWLCAGPKWGVSPAAISTDERGKLFGCTDTGVITLANTTVGEACGKLPTAGCKVRIPNIILSNTSSANYAVNTRTGTLVNRFDFTTTGGGYMEIENVIGHWYLSFSGAFNFQLRKSAISAGMTVANAAAKPLIEDFAVGMPDGVNAVGIDVSACFSGIVTRNVRTSRPVSGSGAAALRFIDCIGVEIEDVFCETFGSATGHLRLHSNTSSLSLLRCANVNAKRVTAIGGRVNVTSTFDVKIEDLRYCDIHNGVTTSTYGISAIYIDASSDNVEFNGFSPFADMVDVHPYGYIVTANNSNNVTIRNFGSLTKLYRTGYYSSAAVTQGLIASGTSKGVNLIRCYLERTRGTLVNTPNTVQRLVVENVWAEGAADSVTAVDTQSRGTLLNFTTSQQNAVYGSHWRDGFFDVSSGAVQLLMNEPIEDTAAQCWISSGSPLFSATGLLVFRNFGDQVTWECPWNILGHTSITGLSWYGTDSNSSTLLFEYQVSNGEAWSPWRVDADLPSEVIEPGSGFYLRVRITRISASVQPSLSFVRINTTTTATAMRAQYPDGQVLVVGAASTDIINLRRLSDDAPLASRQGPGYLKYAAQVGGKGFIVRRNATNVAIMRTEATPFDLVPGDAPVQRVYAGAEIQVADAAGIAKDVWEYQQRSLTDAEAVRQAVKQDLGPLALIPALL